MIDRDVMQWLVQRLRNCDDMISDYMLEYAVALLMNLCLRTAGQRVKMIEMRAAAAFGSVMGK